MPDGLVNLNQGRRFPLPDGPGQVKLPVAQVDLNRFFLFISYEQIEEFRVMILRKGKPCKCLKNVKPWTICYLKAFIQGLTDQLGLKLLSSKIFLTIIMKLCVTGPHILFSTQWGKLIFWSTRPKTDVLICSIQNSTCPGQFFTCPDQNALALASKKTLVSLTPNWEFGRVS